MQPLITGGAGFIGSHLAEWHYHGGMPVTVLDNLSSGKRTNLLQNATLVEGDVADAALVDRLVARASCVYHLAAIASVQVCEQEPERAHRTNVIGTDTIFEAAARHGKTVVYASSAAVYGDNANLPLSEQETPAPLGPYGQHKLANEHSAARFAAQGLKSTGLRFFNVYGPRQDPASPYSGVISIFADRIGRGAPITFHGDGEQTRDFVYVGDVANALVSAQELTRSTTLNGAYVHGGADVLNMCTGRATSLKQLAATLSAVCGTPLQASHGPARVGDIRHSLGDPARVMRALGGRGWTQLADGLRHLHEAPHGA
ncbi:MAG: epimerase [Azospirillum brasilense]|nr:MAG: epimerase [Azospirillum brasilense]